MISTSLMKLSVVRRNRLERLAIIGVIGVLSFAGRAGAQAQPQTRPASSAAAAPQSAPSSLLVTGAVSQDLKLSLDALKKLPRKSVTTKGHDDQMHQYDGVPIGALLAKAGVPQGSALRVVLPADKRQARSVRMLKSITVVNLSGTPQN